MSWPSALTAKQILSCTIAACRSALSVRAKVKLSANRRLRNSRFAPGCFKTCSARRRIAAKPPASSTKVPSGLQHPDGAQRIKNASNKLSLARKEMATAHNRLNDYLSRGIVPEDLKLSG